jgi:hypothetical protein
MSAALALRKKIKSGSSQTPGHRGDYQRSHNRGTIFVTDVEQYTGENQKRDEPGTGAGTEVNDLAQPEPCRRTYLHCPKLRENIGWIPFFPSGVRQ